MLWSDMFCSVLQEKMLKKCQKIVDHGINCFINRQLIYNLPEQFFTSKGVMAIEHADFEVCKANNNNNNNCSPADDDDDDDG